MWISAEQALHQLGVKPQSLYASVSRGRIRARPDPADPRRSLYMGEDVDKLRRRNAGRQPAREVAAETIRWGEPVLPSAITAIVSGRLYYRGQEAVTLAGHHTLEEVARLLWQVEAPPILAASTSLPPLLALAALATTQLPSTGRPAAALTADAVETFATLAAAICGPADASSPPLHRRLAHAWQRPEAAEPLRVALVLLADHELNASTFAARVAVSTGASLAAGALAGLATLTGPLHGTAAAIVRRLAKRAGEIGARAAVSERLAEGASLAAIGHPLYPLGDIRAAALLAAFTPPPAYQALAPILEAEGGAPPNVDFALAALADAYGLPESAPFSIFALARVTGWLAHMLEQRANGSIIRPRARYTGLVPSE